MNELEKLRELTAVLTTNGYLKDQTEAWEYAFNSVETSVIITNTAYKIKFVNDAFNTFIDVNRYDLINNKVSSLLHGELFSKHDELVDVFVDRHFEFETTFIKSLDVWVNKKKYLITNDLNKPVGYLFTIEDVTEKEKALKKLHFMVSTADGYSWEKIITPGNDELTYIYADAKFCNDILGMSVIPEELSCAPIVGSTFSELIAPFIEEGKVHTFGEICKFTDAYTIDKKIICEFIEMGYIEREKGKVEWIIEVVKKTPVLNDSGKCTGLVGTTINCTLFSNDPVAFIKDGIGKGYIDRLSCSTNKSIVYLIKNLQNYKIPLIHVDFP